MTVPRKQSSNSHTLDLVHPAIQLAYFASILIFCMAVMQPVYLSISFIAAFTLSGYLRGWGEALLSLRWQLPIVVLVTLVNPLFSSVGSTELFRIGTRAVYGESILFGFCMGLMLVSIMLWFSNAARVITSDKVLMVSGNVTPTIGLMISMIMRLVPQFVSRGAEIDAVSQACSSATRGIKEKTAGRIRLGSVLMAWGMEDSLETADAMKARGWGASTRRTSYKRYRFRFFDGGMTATLSLLVLGNALLAWVAGTQYHFFPTTSTLVFWWGYLPYVLLVFLPLLICLVEDLKGWHRA